MMKVIGFQTIPVSDIAAEPLPEPDDLVDAIEQAGLIHEPIIRSSDMRIVAGRRRIAAHKALGRDVPVKLVEGTDDELRLWMLQENAHRRELGPDERKEAIRETYDLIAKRIEAEGAPAKPAKKKRGRPPKKDKKAVEETASTLNVSPVTVRRAVEGRKKPAKPVRVTAIETFGLSTSPEWLAAVEKTDELLELAHASLLSAASQVSTLIRKIVDDEASYPASRANRLREAIRKVADLAENDRPIALCWYCKGSPDHCETCLACQGSGVGVKEQEASVPDELRDAEAPVIRADGKLIKLVTESTEADDSAEADEDEEDPWA